MSRNKNMSRTYRQMKKRKNKRIIVSLILLALIFTIILFLLIFKNNNEQQSVSEQVNEENYVNDANNIANDENTEETTEYDSEVNENVQNDDDNSNEEDVVIQTIPSEDENVIEAYVGNWAPIGTIQEEPHTTVYSDDSQDRIEIREAVLSVTKIKDDDLVELWIGNGGEQKVIATVKDSSNDEIYRVYLSWVEYNGWQVTLIEQLKQFNQ